MLLQRFYDDKLAQASFLVGCQACGEGLIVDPNRDLEQYVAAARREGVRITHVTETHIHADYMSGARELAELTGARLLLSGEGGEDWQYAFAATSGATLLHDSDSFMVGNVRVEVMHTPGHTPEHLSFIITDTAASERPMGVFTGDFIFVGDVGRPDLLEKAAKVSGTMEASARALFRSIRRFLARVPDYVQIWPGHGAGSACGKALGAVPQSTVGYEKIANWGLAVTDEEAFVEEVLSGQPEPPTYFAQMKRVNREGPPPRRTGLPSRLGPERLEELTSQRAIIVDTRAPAAFGIGHIPGSLNIPLNRSFNTWAGWILPYDTDFYLLVDERRDAAIDEAVADLAKIGLDRVAGYFDSTVLQRWAESGRLLRQVPQLSVSELSERVRDGSVSVIDVRGAAEWEQGHLPGVPNIPVGYLRDRIAEVPSDKPVAVYCQGGSRSAIAASVLQASGFPEVLNVTGGFRDWAAAGLPVEREGTQATAPSV